MGFFREAVDLLRYFSEKNALARRITFYAESAMYHRYFRGYIYYILEHSDLEICYISSEETDPIFSHNTPRLKTFFLSKLFPYATQYMDARALIYTMDDLHQFVTKRSPNPRVKHLYAMHAANSTTMSHREGAFDFYDTVFCIGPYQKEEILAREKKYALPPKTLLEVGFPYLDELTQQHLAAPPSPAGEKRTALVAPSWHEGNLFETCMVPLVQSLLEGGWTVIVRPHAEHLVRNKKAIQEVAKVFEQEARVHLELDLQNSKGIQDASLLVTDWSGIVFEWAFARESPVLFVNTKMKAPNKNYMDLGIVPMEIQIRDHLGVNINLEEVSNIKTYADDLLKNKKRYVAQIKKFREQNIYNFQHSAEVGGKYILNLL
ncbi:MAG: CDP-glycerol glycerophosphotransferase family protein [Holosporales bacterium]|nr:CDP-glycerol glycerophosphotransferase family protein [Holosporales bacterium]